MRGYAAIEILEKLVMEGMKMLTTEREREYQTASQAADDAYEAAMVAAMDLWSAGDHAGYRAARDAAWKVYDQAIKALGPREVAPDGSQGRVAYEASMMSPHRE